MWKTCECLVLKIYLNWIYRKFYDGVADRTERIITEENINAIRTEDVSGNNGDAVISYFSDRNIVLVFFNEDGNGYNISLELYTNRRKDDADGGAAAARSLSVFSIAVSLTIVMSLYVF